MLNWLGTRRNGRRRTTVNSTCRYGLEPLEVRRMLTITVQFDYSLDTNNFFNTQAKKDLLTQAALALTSRLTDDLSAIQPGGGNTWSAKFPHPGTGAQQTVVDPVIAADTILVYAGGRAFGGNTAGQGGPGGYSTFGTTTWNDLIKGRGEAGALTTPRTDFGPWGGAITFDTSEDWHFGATTVGLDNAETDFLSVATHELGHLLGFGTTESFSALVSGSSFTGPKSVAKYGGNVPLDPGGGHWADGTLYNGQTSLMDPVIVTGTRVPFNELDFAGLDDLGWSLTTLNTAPTLNNSGSPVLGAIGEDAVSNNGTLVSAILASGAGGDPISDPDAGALDGIAVTAVNNANGAWQFSTNSGGNWTAFGSPSNSNARLLAADAATRIRFVPNANFNGAVSAGITFRAWDRTSGTAGGTADASTNGGSTAFSTATETASITVTPANDPPTGINLSASTVAENSPNSTVVGTLTTIDVDAGDSHTYTMLDGAGGRFAVSGNQIVVANGLLLDFETATSHNVSARVTDSGNATFDKTFSITITPANDAPTGINLSASTVAENSPNSTVVGTLTAVDVDAGDSHTYTMLDGAGGRFTVSGNQIVVANGSLLDFETATSHNVSVRVTDSGGKTFDKTFIITLTDIPETATGHVVGRFIFYNESQYDGDSAAAESADDGAIAPDKSPLLPGGVATFANYTSYIRGINGIIVDIANTAAAVTGSNFTFKVGNNNNPAGWAAAPAPTSVTVRTAAGVQNSDRVTIIWADGAIAKTWLQVTVNSGGATGLTTPDVFYFGNQAGESGNAPANAVVDASDEVAARNNPKTFTSPALIDDRYDFNRDGFVNAADQILARSNATAVGSELSLITVPFAALPQVQASDGGSVSQATATNSDPGSLSLALAGAQTRTIGSESVLFLNDLAIAQVDSSYPRSHAQDAVFAPLGSSDVQELSDSSGITPDDWLSNVFDDATLELFGDPWD